MSGNQLQEAQGKNRKNRLFKLIFILINVITIAVLLIIEMQKGNILNFSEAMATLSRNIIWLLLALAALIIKFLADAYSYYILIKKSTGESRFVLAMKTCLAGRYGDGITPLSTGGQPFQIYYLHKYNVDISKAASIPLAKVVVKILAYNITMLLFFIFFQQEGSIVVKTTAYIALSFNTLLPVIIILFALNKSLGYKVTNFFLKIGVRLKIVKDFEKARDYWYHKVEDMLFSIKSLLARFRVFVPLFLLGIIDLICLTSIPYLVYRAFGGDGSISWLFMLVSSMYVISAALMAPTPGTSGAAEASFYTIFETVIVNGLMFYALITWRLITFYSFIFVGLLMIIYESTFKKKHEIDLLDEKSGRVTNRQRRASEKQAAKEKAECLELERLKAQENK